MSDSIQITIPDLGGDDDYSFGGNSSSTTAFGRGNAFGFGSGGGGAFSAGLGLGDDSPTLSTPTPLSNPFSERSGYFGSHSRGDSVTSVESTGSGSGRVLGGAYGGYAIANRSQTSFTTITSTAPSNISSSTAITNTPAFSKKPSFASIRNAFKGSNKYQADLPPPLPPTDILKGGWNMSSSSLVSSNISSRTAISSPRPSTPSRGRKGHAPGKSSGSNTLFGHISDAGSDSHFGSSPPPVPRLPSQAIEPDVDEDYKVDMNPKTPSDFALHAVFMRFATSAEAKIDAYLKQSLDLDPLLPSFLGPDIDTKFDEILRSLGQIAQKHAKPVIGAIMRWRQSQLGHAGSEWIRLHTASRAVISGEREKDRERGSSDNNNSKIIRTHDVPGLLTERKSLASIYIMCRALIAIVQSLGQSGGGGISESTGYELEKTTFDQFKKPDLKLLMQSKNHRINADLSAELLGGLANIRFVSVTDRFLAELKAIALGQVPKDLDMKYENLVHGLRHLQIKVWPPESFEEGAEFMESLSKSFVHAHGNRLKSAFAETLVKILHPIGGTAQTEPNHPLWAKAIENIYPKSREMAGKPRYWNAAFPLMIVSLCVSPEQWFKKHWSPCFETTLGALGSGGGLNLGGPGGGLGALGRTKAGEKSFRPVVNGLIRLLWTYLYRCQESASTTTTKLDTLLKYFFPANRIGVYPSPNMHGEDQLEFFTLIVHFVLSRHFEYGRDFLLELMHESALTSANSNNPSGNAMSNVTVSPERTAIAVQAFLLTMHAFERESHMPMWPPNSDFFAVPSISSSSPSSAANAKPTSEKTLSDYPTSSAYLPSTHALLSGAKSKIIVESFDRVSSVLATITSSCYTSVGSMSVFDEQYLFSRMTNLSNGYDEAHSFVVRKHPEYGTMAYHVSLSPQVNLLQTCFKAWPRLLRTTSISVQEAIDMLLKGMVHVEPGVGEAARDALALFIEVPSWKEIVVEKATHFLFNPQRISSEGGGSNVKLVFEDKGLLDIWVAAVEAWTVLLTTGVVATSEEEDGAASKNEEDVHKLLQEVEAGCMVLLSHETRHVHAAGVKAVKALGKLADADPALAEYLPFTQELHHGSSHAPSQLKPYLEGFEEFLDKSEAVRLDYWKTQAKDSNDIILRLAESSCVGKDRDGRFEKRMSEGKGDVKADRALWRYIFARWIQWFQSSNSSAANSATTASSQPSLSSNLTFFRDSLIAAATRYHPTISQLAGLSVRLRTPVAPSASNQYSHLHSNSNSAKAGARLVQDNKNLIAQWQFWINILCATATLPESVGSRPALRDRDHIRAPSHPTSSSDPSSPYPSAPSISTNFEKERFSTSRGLFRFLTPFLDSEYTLFRDAAVLCISSFPGDAYPQLLEDLSLLAGRQFYDDPRAKGGLGSNSFGAGGSIDRMRRQERLHSAVAHIYFLTSVNLPNAGNQYNYHHPNRQSTLSNVLKFVRNTHSFLTSPEVRDNHTLHPLRRYFCGTVERLFEGLGTLKDSDRFIPKGMHLVLYRFCEEWCIFGEQGEVVRRRVQAMERAVEREAGTHRDDREREVERFQEESLMLSYAAVGAMGVLCHKAFSPPGVSSGSPTNNNSPDHLKPLTATNVLERLNAILGSSHPPTQERGKQALKSILLVNSTDTAVLDEALRRAIVTSEQVDTSAFRFLQVISSLVDPPTTATTPSPVNSPFTFAQVVCLALANLCHPSSKVRKVAFDMLELVHHQAAGLLSMSHFEASSSYAESGSFVHSHGQIADFLANEHPHEAPAILAQLGSWLGSSPSSTSGGVMTMLLLQSLEFWIPNIDLMSEDRTRLSEDGHLALYHLMSLTLRFSTSHPEQILVLWTRLVEPPNQFNGHATIRFLLEQSHKVGSTVFIDSAAHILSCICQSAAGLEIFVEVCSVIEPNRMLPTIEHKLTFPDAHDMELWSELDALFVDGRPRLPLGSAQFALLFLADVSVSRQWEMTEQLPVLLHALFIHLDNRTSYIRLKARQMLFRLLRAWAPGYDELSDRLAYPGRSVLKDELAGLEAQAEEMFWKEEEKGSEIEKKVRWLSSRVIIFLEPLCPHIREKWGTLALEWGTSCSIRLIAFRSLQIFRALSPRVRLLQLAFLLGRLSNTIAAPDDSVKLFSTEIILTLNAVISSPNFEMSLLPQIFWCACAALNTTIEQEFSEVLKLLETILTKVDFDDPAVVEALISHRPLEWKGTDSLQRNLLCGLRSSVTSSATFRILQHLTFYNDGRLIDDSSGRVRDLYTLSLPWCLYAMTPEQTVDDSLRRFAENIGMLAKAEGRPSIHKIMTSFAKGIFRTRDDFLRQSVSSLREHYGVDSWTEIVTLLMGLVLNSEQWLRIQTMQVLKVLFQQRETRSPVELWGSELLMPLLRLLESDLASQALDVLEEPMTMFGGGGLAAKHILRMSMHTPKTVPMLKEVDSNATVFGVPEESGWCVVRADEMRETCRGNVESVFDTCSMPSRPSRIEFEPEEVEGLASPTEEEAEGGEDLGGLVQNLHDLTTFFQEDESSNVDTSPGSGVPNKRLEARVAAILAKSTANGDVPHTPFIDVFNVGEMSSDEEDSDTYSIDSDSDDAFCFDSR